MTENVHCNKCSAVLQGKPKRGVWYQTLTFHVDAKNGHTHTDQHNYCAPCLRDIMSVSKMDAPQEDAFYRLPDTDRGRVTDVLDRDTAL